LNDKSCNFFEDLGIYDGLSKIVARKYATLYFILVIDEDESELGILDLIQVIYRILNEMFIISLKIMKIILKLWSFKRFYKYIYLL
jgi:hypothetical protein